MDKIKTLERRKNLEEFKSQVAKQYLESHLMKVPDASTWIHFTQVVEPSDIYYALEMAANLYAEYCCREQQKLDSEYAKPDYNTCSQFNCSGTSVDKDSILNAPLFVHQSK